jgi:hypothetical protein
MSHHWKYCPVFPDEDKEMLAAAFDELDREMREQLDEYPGIVDFGMLGVKNTELKDLFEPKPPIQ